MPQSSKIILLPILAALCGPSFGSARLEASGPPEGLEERVEARLVRIPVTLSPRSPGDCDDLSAGSIAVVEDGRSVPALHLERHRLKTLHAVLVDTAPELVDYLQAARSAVRGYVASLPPDEPALLATFDDKLLLHAPISTDRDRFSSSLDWIEPGGGTRLWDAASQMIRFLQSRPERKVLILLTNGCDNGHPQDPTARQVLSLATGSVSLSVFPVGVDVPPRCTGSGEDPKLLLKELAQATGGRYGSIDDPGRLAEVFRAVRERMDRERYLVYTPSPFGEGGRDTPRKADHRWRKLRLRQRGKSRCTVSIAGPRIRCESRRGSGACDPPPSRTLRRPFELAADAVRLDGEVIDVIRGGGGVLPSLFDPVPPAGHPRAEERGIRRVSGWVPPLRSVIRDDARPVDPFIYALSRFAGFDGEPVEPGVARIRERWTDSPFLIHGRTLLDVRGSLARALGQHPKYRSWAVQKIRSARLAVLDEVIETTDDAGVREALSRARGLIADDPGPPEPLELEQHLGAWLGDVPATRILVETEAWLAGELLRTVRHDGPERIPAAWDEVRGLWRRLTAWLPVPEDNALLGLLVPGYDPGSQSVGFYRAVLTVPYSTTIKDMFLNADPGAFVTSSGGSDYTGGSLYAYLQSFNASREAPLGARLVRWMLDQQTVRSELLGGFDVAAVRYAHSGSRDLRPTLEQGRFVRPFENPRAVPARQVVIRLRPKDRPGDEFLIGAYFERAENGYADEPICLLLPGSAMHDDHGQALFDGLIRVHRRAPIPCLLTLDP